jgi:hypothetical protein
MKKIEKIEKFYTFDSVEEVKEKVDLESLLYADDYLVQIISDIKNMYIEDESMYIVEFLSMFGFNLDYCYSLNNNQGDGAVFYGDWSRPAKWDIVKYCKEYGFNDSKETLYTLKEVTKKYSVEYFKINKVGRYCHSKSWSLELYYDDFDSEKYSLEEVKNTLKEIIEELEYWFENKLESIAYSGDDIEILANFIIDNEVEIEEKYIKG